MYHKLSKTVQATVCVQTLPESPPIACFARFSLTGRKEKEIEIKEILQL